MTRGCINENLILIHSWLIKKLIFLHDYSHKNRFDHLSLKNHFFSIFEASNLKFTISSKLIKRIFTKRRVQYYYVDFLSWIKIESEFLETLITKKDHKFSGHKWIIVSRTQMDQKFLRQNAFFRIEIRKKY